MTYYVHVGSQDLREAVAQHAMSKASSGQEGEGMIGKARGEGWETHRSGRWGGTLKGTGSLGCSGQGTGW